MEVLREPSRPWPIFFSISEAQKIFGIQSQWLTSDEWFAIECIPAEVMQKHIQLVDGILPYGKPYKLVLTSVVKTDMVTVETLDIDELCRRRREDMTEEEADKEWAKASEAAEENGFASDFRYDDCVYQKLSRDSQTRLGVLTMCVETSIPEGPAIEILVMTSTELV